MRLEVHHVLGAAGLLVVLLFFMALAWMAGNSTRSVDRIGLRAPTFTLPALGGGTSYGTAELQGRPTIVVFWAPGCAPCVEELRMLQQSWERHRPEGLTVVGVQVGFSADVDDVGLLEANGVTFRNVRDRSGVVAGAFGLVGVPEIYFLDPEWRVQAIDRGTEIGVNKRQALVLLSGVSPELLERRITELLRTERLPAS